jgi:hypothetical protein
MLVRLKNHVWLKTRLLLVLLPSFVITQGYAINKPILFCGNTDNDLYVLLTKEGYTVKKYGSPVQAIAAAETGAVLIITSPGYPEVNGSTSITSSLLSDVQRKKIKLYIECPSAYPGLDINPNPVEMQLERAVVTSNVFADLKPMSIIGLNNCFILRIAVNDPLLVMARVVGFDKAEYGLDSTRTYPLLFEKDNAIIATTSLSRFASGRYGPVESIKKIWTYILSKLTGDPSLKINQWLSTVGPMYQRNDKLPANARRTSIQKGIEWFNGGRFFVHPQWNDFWLKFDIRGDGTSRFAPALGPSFPNGDGSLGILEGHASSVNYDGTQPYRYWMRADIQGEASMALAAAGKYLQKKEYNTKAANLIDYIFKNSNLRAGAKNDTGSAVYGMIGWATTFPGSFYGDDNARAILGAIAASAYLNTNKWDKELTEAIMANFRRTSKQCFSGDRNEENRIIKNGWQYYWNRDYVYMSPNFEAWMWACYLWLYDKTGYKPLLDKTKIAIRLMMEGYPNKWLWGSSFQSQRARLVLPLAWLVRVEDTKEHREWLDRIASDILKNQVDCGAIREEIGEGKGHFKELKSNKDYGTDEGSLIFRNGDPVSDMLYTNNFALFTLNEAAHATGNPQYKQAVDKLSDFLTRIQIKSDKHKDLDGAWFRAFEYNRWDYWASNSDWGWGAWCTLTGWCQSWIVAIQIQVEEKQNYWDVTRKSSVKNYMDRTVAIMFNDATKK